MTSLKRGSVTGQANSPLYLLKVDFAQHLEYNQSLTTATESPLFGSVVRALVFYRGDPGSIPSEYVGIFSAMLYILWLSCLKTSPYSTSTGKYERRCFIFELIVNIF